MSTGARHAPRMAPNASSTRSLVESLWAAGKTATQIATATGCTVAHVQEVIRRIQAHAKMVHGDENRENRDDHHLELISKSLRKPFGKKRTGFPFYRSVPI